MTLVAPADSTHTLCARRWGRIVDPEEPLHAPDHAADRGSDNRADWACNAIAFSRAMLEAAGKTTLSLGGDRSRQGGDDGACTQQCRFHETSPLALVRQCQTPANVGVSVTMAWRAKDKRLIARLTNLFATSAAISSQWKIAVMAAGTTIMRRRVRRRLLSLSRLSSSRSSSRCHRRFAQSSVYTLRNSTTQFNPTR